MCGGGFVLIAFFLLILMKFITLLINNKYKENYKELQNVIINQAPKINNTLCATTETIWAIGTSITATMVVLK